MFTTNDARIPLPPRSELALPGARARRRDDVSGQERPAPARGALLVIKVVRTPDESPLQQSLVELVLPRYAIRLGTAVRQEDRLEHIGDTCLGMTCLGVSDWQPLSQLLTRLHRAAGPPLALSGGEGYAAVSITAVLADDAVRRLRFLQQSATE
ncbi:hypothetical protein JCM9957A_38010 [Kineosporia succinea]